MVLLLQKRLSFQSRMANRNTKRPFVPGCFGRNLHCHQTRQDQQYMGQIAGNQIIDYDGETYPVNWYGACPTKILVSCGKAASGGAMGRDLDLMGMYKKTDLSPGTNHNGRPIYQNSHAKYPTLTRHFGGPSKCRVLWCSQGPSQAPIRAPCGPCCLIVCRLHV